MGQASAVELPADSYSLRLHYASVFTMEREKLANRDTAALEAMKLLKEWVTWLVAIQTAAIGGLIVGLKDFFPFDKICRVPDTNMPCDAAARLLGSGVVLAFGIAIITSLYLLLALPALAERMPHTGEKDDFFSMRTVGFGLHAPLYWYARAVRWSSFWGFVLLAALVLLLIWTRNA
jgi:hypothetical protein